MVGSDRNDSHVSETSEPVRHRFGIGFLIRYRHQVSALLTIVLIGLVGIAVYRFADEVNYDVVIASLLATPTASVALAVLFTAASFCFLVLYDRNALAFVRRPLPLAQVALTSFVAYAIGNAAGFGALSGGAIRYRAYSRLGLAPDEIGRIIAFLAISFAIGVALLGTLSLLFVAEEASVIIGANPLAMRIVAGAVVVVCVGCFLVARRRGGLKIGPVRIGAIDGRMLLRQFFVIFGDIVASASVLYILLPETAVSWPAFVCIFSIALGLALVSHVPAGIGVFEAVIIAAMGGTQNIDVVLGSLVLFRLVYYILPLSVAIVLLVIVECHEFATASGLRRLREKQTDIPAAGVMHRSQNRHVNDSQ